MISFPLQVGYQFFGTSAETKPAVADGSCWLEVDTGDIYTRTGAAWVLVTSGTGGGGSGTVTNTGTLTAGQLIVGNGGVDVSTLSLSGVTPGTYGDATNVAQVTVDSKGLVTAAVDVPISVSATVSVDPAGALNGDGSGGSPLAVKVDGVTVIINGSNELESIGSGADPNLTYLTEDDESADLPNSRQLLAGTGITFDDTTPNERTINATGSSGIHLVPVTIDGGGSVIATGIRSIYATIPVTGNITGYRILSTLSGDIEVDLYKATYAAFPTFSLISSTNPIELSGVDKNEDSTLTGWTLGVTAGDILDFDVITVTTVERVVIAIEITE